MARSADSSFTPIGRVGILGWCAAVLLVLSLGLDSVPRFHLGDSGSYLMTRWNGFIPEDRSWTYGLVICPILYMSKDLSTVLLAQVAFSCVCLLVLVRALARYFNLAAGLSMILLGVAFANPLDFYWSRAFMTDAPAASVFAVLVALLLACRSGVILYGGSFLLLWLIGSLRSVYLPPLFVAFAGVALLSLLRTAWRRGRADRRHHLRTASRYALLSACVVAAYVGYAVVNAMMLRTPDISANHAAPRFLVSAWSPLMDASADQLGLSDAERSALAPFTYRNRIVHAFSEDGIDETLRRHFGSYAAAKPAYEQLIRNAVLHQPVKLTQLLLRSWGDYLNPTKVLLYHHEKRLSGATSYNQPDRLDPALLNLLRRWTVWQPVAADLPQANSFGLRYFAAVGGYWALLLSGFGTIAVLLLALLPRSRRTPEIIALNIFAFAYMAMVAATTNELVTRYLLALSIPLVAWLAALFSRTRNADGA